MSNWKVLTGDPVISVNFQRKKPYRVEKEIIVSCPFGGQIVVPVGFECDGVSTPRPLHWIIRPAGIYLLAGIVHDYIYEVRGVSRRYADHVYLDLCLQVGGNGYKNKIKSFPSFYMLRIFGWIAWLINKGGIK